jgi:ribose 5-phosphate isomerase A
MDPREDAKRAAARAAIAELAGAKVVGLGTGSTAALFVDELGRHLCELGGGRPPSPGAPGAIVAVPTSEATRRQATNLGIELLGDEGPWDIDVNVDGADEVSASLDLIKGGGGAHAREKIVNYAARKNVIVVDDGKMSARLGERRAVPVEVLPFAHGTTRRHLARHGEPQLRVRDGGVPARTDAGNLLYDLRVEPIGDPAALDAALRAIPGVVETGLFVARADVVIVSDASGAVRRIAKLA